MTRSLHARLIWSLLSLLALAGALLVGLAIVVGRLHVEEASQRLNRDLARDIVAHEPLMIGSAVNAPALRQLFKTLMVINPRIEVYLVDDDGRVIAFDAPEDVVVRRRIDLGPVRAFLDGGASLPLRGDDPRQATGRKIFSAAPIRGPEGTVGYLYIVLAGGAWEDVAEMMEESTILHLALGATAAALLVTLIVGTFVFLGLTRRLRRLTRGVERFQQSDFQAAEDLLVPPRTSGGDEIDQLSDAFSRMARRIQGQIAELGRSDAVRRELVANISHDLRTPMAALAGSLETLQMMEGQTTAETQAQHLEVASQHAARLARLIEELFELARLESGEPRLNLEPFSLAELVQDVAQKFALQAERRKLRLETEIPSSAAFVRGDIGLIERVLENLLENALKFTPEGGVVRLALVAGVETVAARVSDNGVGIPADELPRVFERAYRGSRDEAQGAEGTGLGLAIAQRILHLHGSRIEVESELGAGTAFTFALPAPATGSP